MNVTIEIPQQIATSPSMIKELKKVLTDYAILWMSRAEKKDCSLSDEYELPEKYEKLCGCISEEKIREGQVTVPDPPQITNASPLP